MKKLLSSIVVAGLLVTSSFAADAKTENIKHNAVLKAENKAHDKKIIIEAIRALKYTQDAYIYLNAKKTDKAKESLKKAIGELTVVLNTPNAPYLLPVDVNMEAFEYVGSIKNIAKQITAAKVALAKSELPLARNILNTLKSEIDIKAVNIPLATYPDAIKLAIKYINEGKVKEAKDVIAMALNTLVTTDTIIPIPLVKANELVIAASKISHKNKQQTLKYLEEAKKQIKLAELLGYTSKSDTTYKMLKDSIDNIESKIKNNKKTDSFFEELKSKLKEFKEKAVSIISK
jgi:hypothetical protein